MARKVYTEMEGIFCRLLFVFLSSLTLANGQQCEAISLSMCEGIGYNMTLMPNAFQHTTQIEADLEINQFAPLVEVGCSPYLKPFLCSMYVPVCTVLLIYIPPCREVCEKARAGCQPILEHFGFHWPESLTCDKLPQYDEGLCIPFHEMGGDSAGDDSANGNDLDAETEVDGYGDADSPVVPVTSVPNIPDNGNDIGQADTSVCEAITIPMCQGIGYEMTRMPNFLHHATQEEAGMEIGQFYPLVKVGCAPELQFLLCFMYAPICVEHYSKLLPPCMDVCERARTGCEPLMNRFGFEWPESLHCDRFPLEGDPNFLCLSYSEN